MANFYQFANQRGKSTSYGDLVDEYLDGALIYAPQQLIESLNKDSSFNRKGKELCCLIYNHIRTKFLQNKKQPVSIYHSTLEFDTTPETTNQAKNWLKDRNYISYCTSYANYANCKRSKKYSAKSMGKEKLLHLKILNNKTGTGYTQENDHLCQYTRKMLDNLHFDPEQVKAKLKQELKNSSKKECLHIIRKNASRLLDVTKRTGVIRRGPSGNRLHSPFVTLKKTYRNLFSFDNDPMINIDMRAAHPTLLGNLAKDYKLIDDCIQNVFYEKMPCFSEKGRDAAKKEYYKLAYGPIRDDLEVTDVFCKEYPKAYQFMLDNKPTNYRKFSHMMQQKESDIWIGQIYQTIADNNISAISIHDSIFCKQSQEDTVLEIINNAMYNNNMIYKIHIEDNK